MRLSLLLSVSLLAAGSAAALQHAADDYFNTGAQFYISNNIPQAKQFVTNGLSRYPQDEKLLKLKKLLDQQQQQQNQQQQQQQQKDRQQSQQNQSQQQQSQADQKKADEQKQQEQPKQQQQQPSDADKKDQQDKQEQADQEKPVPGQMSKQEANRLLDSQKDNEQLLQFKPKDKPRDSNRPVKDW